MSSVTFHSPDGDVAIGGAERMFAGSMCRRLFWATLGVDEECDVGRTDGIISRIHEMLAPDHYAHPSNKPNFMSRHHGLNLLKTALSPINDQGTLKWNGQSVCVLSLNLNTALAIGSDAVKFATRMHGQCELHAFVMGKNRAWLADIIDVGHQSCVLRQPFQNQYGTWHDVAALLRGNRDTPIVMSYSACDSFPRGPWNIAFSKLKKASEDGLQLELSPDDWQTYRFGHGLSAFDLVHDDWRGRLDRVFPPCAD